MPTYEYRCTSCERPFELKATIAEYEHGLDTECPWCGSHETKRQLSAAFVSAAGTPEPVPVGPSRCCGGGACGLD